ncbi:MAG: YceI family protein [Deltaproteobacteria bacterium]|nr:YceI family protein [Deltaproteobacteria bacterium]
MKSMLFLALASLLTLPSTASAEPMTIETRKLDVTFHISHPAKEFDSFLLPDGGLGTITIDPQAMEATKAAFSLKVDHFNSDNTRRDSHMIEVMEGLVFPTIDWDVQSVSGATGPWTPGVHSFKAKGPITVHGVTKAIEVPVEFTIGGQGEITFGANFTVGLEDYGIERPTLVFVPIENEVPIIVKVDTKPNPDLVAAAAAKPEPPASTPEGSEEAAPDAAASETDAPAEPVDEPAKNE